jgi:phosphate transport system permease protein
MSSTPDPTSTPPPATPPGTPAGTPGDPLREPTPLEIVCDRAFRYMVAGFGWLTVLVLVLLLLLVGYEAAPEIQAEGLKPLVSSVWNPNPPYTFGIAPSILGTLYSSVLAILIATVLGVSVAIFLTEDFVPVSVRTVLRNLVELLAAIPSVIYGLWGLGVLVPLIRGPANWLHDHFGWFPLFSTPFGGSGTLPAVLVLVVMLLPTITALSRDAIAAVPNRLREGSLAMGATRWETILKIILPTAVTGILGAVILAFGRAMGETMALAMLVGNSNQFEWSILAPSNTLAALLANKFGEAIEQPEQRSALMLAALVLLIITLLVNICGSLIAWRAARQLKGLN